MPVNISITSEIPIGWHFVFNHLGAIIMGNFSTKSRIISKEALPEPIMIPARKVVSANFPLLNSVSTFFLNLDVLIKSQSLLFRLNKLLAEHSFY